MNIATIFEEVVMNNDYWKTSLVGSYSLLPVAILQATMIVGGNLGIRGWAIYGEDMAKGIKLCTYCTTLRECMAELSFLCLCVYCLSLYIHDFVFSFYLHYTKTLYTTKTHLHKLSAITVFS